MTRSETIALVIAAAAFLAFVLWQVRPIVGGKRRPLRGVLKDARARIDAAKTDEARAFALCDAGDACAAAVGRKGEAAQFYLRAMRQLPSSADIVERACHGLAKSPRVLEKLLWRRLGSEEWAGETLASAKTALKALAVLYAHSLHDHVRARALEHALAALNEKV